MRVLHVIPSYLPARRYGGTIFATHALCAALARAGCDVAVFTTNVDGAGVSSVPPGIPVTRDGVQIRYFPVRSPRRLYYSPAMGEVLTSECGAFDLLHLHSVFLWPTWVAAHAARRTRTPYLLAPRGMLVKKLIERKNMLLKRAWIGLIERRNIERAAGIHVTSPIEADELRRFGFRLPTVHEVPNGFDTDADDGPDEKLAPPLRHLLEGVQPVILSLGRIHPKKGLDRLIRALTQVPHARLLVAGNDEEGHTSELERLAVNVGVRERVHFVGSVFGKAKAELYRRSSVFVLPSHSENFGNVVLEAMAQGCPVVVTPEVGAAKIVEETGGGLVAAGDPAALARAIVELLDNAALRSEMGLRGQERVRLHYSWDRVAQRMLEVYGDVVASRDQRPSK